MKKFRKTIDLANRFYKAAAKLSLTPFSFSEEHEDFEEEDKDFNKPLFSVPPKEESGVFPKLEIPATNPSLPKIDIPTPPSSSDIIKNLVTRSEEALSLLRSEVKKSNFGQGKALARINLVLRQGEDLLEEFDERYFGYAESEVKNNLMKEYDDSFEVFIGDLEELSSLLGRLDSFELALNTIYTLWSAIGNIYKHNPDFQDL